MDPAEASKFVQVLRSTFTALEVILHLAHNLEIFHVTTSACEEDHVSQTKR